MKKNYLTVTAVVLILMGLIFLLAPKSSPAGFGQALGDPSLLNVLRSFGGFYLACAVGLILARSRENLVDGAVVGVVLVMAGFLTGRLVSLGLDGLPDPKLWVSAVVELFLAAWGLFLLRRIN